MKKSGTITGKLILFITILISGTILFTVLMNSFFLDDYYETKRENDLRDTYSLIDNAVLLGTSGTESFSVQLQIYTDRGNIDAILISPEGTVLRSTANDYNQLREQFMTLLLLTDSGREKIEETDDYLILKHRDERLQRDYLVLWGTLSDGNFVMLRSALESIQDTAMLSNKFLLGTGLLAAAVGIVLTLLFTRRMTRPIVQLSGISKRMAELDFEAKYEGTSYQEVDELGENMNQLSSNLERTISELKSANNALLLDNERKTEIDEMRKEFLSNVSHELKTPLALIRGYAEGLSDGIMEDDQESRKFYCEVITDEADKMSTMVGKLLSLNQLEFGGSEVTMERFDVSEMIRGVLSLSSLLFEQEGIRVSYEEKDPIFVWADENLTEGVLTNYVSNALHHCKEGADGEKRIRVTVRRMENLVRICVFNTGLPIPEEELQKIWIKFYKVDKARTREYGGSGIGLSIVKASMDLMHRECGVQNLEDGVEFFLELDTGAGNDYNENYDNKRSKTE